MGLRPKTKANDFPVFLEEAVDSVARKLLGCELERTLNGQIVRARIVETESYDQEDAASHAFGGKRSRNASMFGPAGHLYVYFTYGMHYCCNIVTGPEGYGSGVLIRAVEPLEGLDLIESTRHLKGIEATNGPAKLCQALGIDLSLDGHDLHELPLRLHGNSLKKGEQVITTHRIGISKARDKYRRFYIQDNPYVSGRNKNNNKN